MHLANRYLSALCLTAALAAGSSISAAALPQDAHVQIRVYDDSHKDYHDWDEREDRAYRHYLEEKHEQYRAYEKMKYKEQHDYWEWRHSHPD
jgi:hypothetical protein